MAKPSNWSGTTRYRSTTATLTWRRCWRAWAFRRLRLFQAAPYLASGELVKVLADWSRPAVPMHVVYPPNRHLSAKVRAFVDWAAELFAKHPHL